MTTTIPQTHRAIAVTRPRSPLALITRPTTPPSPTEALVRVTWTSSAPIDLHRADGGLGVPSSPDTEAPFILGCTFGGTVVALGSDLLSGSDSASSHLRVGDEVFGFVQDGDDRQAGFQEYVAVPAWRVSKLPGGWGMREAVTVPCNLVTAFHTLTADLGLALPWPRPEGWAPPDGAGNKVVLVWGAASGVGMYVLQVLRYWGYGNVVAVASAKHHEMLKELGARVCFDYRREEVVEEVLGYVEGVEGAGGPRVPYIVDCIGSVEGTLRPLTKIAEAGSKVAVMMPVIRIHAGKGQASELETDITKVLPEDWKKGVEVKATRTFFYMKVS